MKDLNNAFWIETRKVLRSRMPFFTLIGFLLLPLACAFLMVVYKDPTFARDIGLISAKANLVGGTADWPFYLNMFAQGTAIGSIILFSLVLTWVFGREFSDGTLKDLLAVPITRTTIILAKFIVAALWCACMAVVTYLTALFLGALIGLPLGSAQVIWHGSITMILTALLVILTVTPAAFFASIGRGYLLPMGMAFLGVILANMVAILGYGEYFPLSIPALYAGMSTNETLSFVSYAIAILTGAAGIFLTHLWWKYADQSR